MHNSTAFGVLPTLGLDEITTLNGRIARARRFAAELRSAVQNWRRTTTFSPHYELRDPERGTFDTYVNVSKAYPHNRWAIVAGDLAHSARVALDNFNDLLVRRYATKDYDPNRLSFPITSSGKDWRSWKRAHDALPTWLVERYRQVQPKVPKFEGLATLARINNHDKHVWLQDVSITPTGLVASSEFLVEGLEPLEAIEPTVAEVYLRQGQRRLHISTTTLNRRILNLPDEGSSDSKPLVNFHVAGRVSQDATSLTLDQLADLPNLVARAINFVNSGPHAS